MGLMDEILQFEFLGAKYLVTICKTEIDRDVPVKIVKFLFDGRNEEHMHISKKASVNKMDIAVVIDGLGVYNSDYDYALGTSQATFSIVYLLPYHVIEKRKEKFHVELHNLVF